ncbi:alpha/beta fold hydrolase [Agromyces rhizosphaerae]|nr:alpha/beta fold hydrolase [Agromyces rhizosphaerae]
MRATMPTTEGTVERDGASVHWEVYGEDGPTILLAPTWELVHSRNWKMQVSFLARHYRVVLFDAVGNGKSSRPADAGRYSWGNRDADAIAVLDATGTERCVVVGYSMGGELALTLAALHPERVDGVVTIGAAHEWVVPMVDRAAPVAPAPGEKPEGWAKYDPDYWRTDYRDFAEWFVAQVVSDPHSTKAWDDGVGWAMETTGDVLAALEEDYADLDLEDMERRIRSIDVPVLLLHGTDDQIVHPGSSELMHAWIPGSDLVLIEGSGHSPHTRFPVKVNHLIKGFADRVYGLRDEAATWHVGIARPKTALYLSSPIGLGHARRDIAIAGELRTLHPDLQIDWLAQDPVTRVLDAAGERIHEASAALAGESAHIESECSDHSLAVFQSLRTMDEILVHNFMVFDEVAQRGEYDLIIADESWEVDHYLHENPNLKRGALAWMTDFVGYLPIPERGAREAAVVADYNQEMITHVERYGRVRDAAVFVGSPDDIVPDRFGEGMPLIRDWTEEHFDFAGYVTGFDPAALGSREALRAELGYRDDERVCIVSVGGSGVGTDLIRRVVASYPEAKRAIPELRMIVVTGPRIDPATLPQIDGVEYRAYVDRLYRHLAACDLAIVQGGLTTTMELAACRVPFIYVPLRDHFEQNFHVRARLDRYRAGRCMQYSELSPDALASAMASLVGAPVDYRPVETDGAARAAAMIGKLL